MSSMLRMFWVRSIDSAESTSSAQPAESNGPETARQEPGLRRETLRFEAGSLPSPGPGQYGLASMERTDVPHKRKRVPGFSSERRTKVARQDGGSTRVLSKQLDPRPRPRKKKRERSIASSDGFAVGKPRLINRSHKEITDSSDDNRGDGKSKVIPSSLAKESCPAPHNPENAEAGHDEPQSGPQQMPAQRRRLRQLGAASLELARTYNSASAITADSATRGQDDGSRRALRGKGLWPGSSVIPGASARSKDVRNSAQFDIPDAATEFRTGTEPTNEENMLSLRRTRVLMATQDDPAWRPGGVPRLMPKATEGSQAHQRSLKGVWSGPVGLLRPSNPEYDP